MFFWSIIWLIDCQWQLCLERAAAELLFHITAVCWTGLTPLHRGAKYNSFIKKNI